MLRAPSPGPLQEIQVICDTYTVPRSPSLIMTDYKTFLNDVEIVFTLPVRRRS